VVDLFVDTKDAWGKEFFVFFEFLGADAVSEVARVVFSDS